jgi:hypothetical protein
MSLPLGHAGHHRQDRLGPIQRLDLGFFIHRDHDRIHRRVEIQTDHITDLGLQSRIVENLNVSMRRGWISHFRQILATVEEIPR